MHRCFEMMGEAAPPHAGGHGGGGGGTPGAGGWVSGSAGSASETGSSSSFFSSSSSTSTLAGEEDDDKDGATSSSRPASSSLSSLSLASSESETVQVDGPAGGPLYELSTMLDHLPSLRTGLSKHYQGRSQSFRSLADVSCVEDLVKKTTPYTRRPKAFRRHTAALGVKNRLSKTVAKKATRGRKPPASACQGKRELYRC